MRRTAILALSTVTLALTACGAPGGGVQSAALQPLALTRASGALDPTYGTAGIVNPAGGQFSAGLAIQQNGAALVLTGSGRSVFPPGLTTTLTRLTPQGQADATFGQRGAVTLSGGAGALALVCLNGANSYSDWGAACDLPERPLVAVTFSSRDTPRQTDLKLYRFLPSGQPDPAFGQNGVVTAPPAWRSYVVSIRIQADGKMLLAGGFIGTPGGGYLGRLNRNGTPDLDFGTDGLVRLPPDQTPMAMVLPESEYPVVLIFGSTSVSVARFTDAGQPDTRFGSGGMVGFDFGPSGNGYALLARENGKVVVGGTGALYQARADGKPDPGFGMNGRMALPNQTVNGLTLDDQGRLVAGVDGVAGRGKATVARFLPGGSLDPSFGTGGLASVLIGPGAGSWGFDQVAVQRDGRILGAATHSFHHADNVAVARLLP